MLDSKDKLLEEFELVHRQAATKRKTPERAGTSSSSTSTSAPQTPAIQRLTPDDMSEDSGGEGSKAEELRTPVGSEYENLYDSSDSLRN